MKMIVLLIVLCLPVNLVATEPKKPTIRPVPLRIIRQDQYNRMIQERNAWLQQRATIIDMQQEIVGHAMQTQSSSLLPVYVPMWMEYERQKAFLRQNYGVRPRY
jgi:hypothetical protein